MGALGGVVFAPRRPRRGVAVANPKRVPWSLYQFLWAARVLLPAAAHLINDTRFDCAKDNVHRHMRAVFGYSSAVNSEASINRGVIKSRTNRPAGEVRVRHGKSVITPSRVAFGLPGCFPRI